MLKKVLESISLDRRGGDAERAGRDDTAEETRESMVKVMGAISTI